jgi:ubiquinone biosynthesis protein UbiJ
MAEGAWRVAQSRAVQLQDNVECCLDEIASLRERVTALEQELQRKREEADPD